MPGAAALALSIPGWPIHRLTAEDASMAVWCATSDGGGGGNLIHSVALNGMRSV